jgi:hypothetical protein
MQNDKRDTLDTSTRNENIGAYIRESNIIAAFDSPLPKMMTCLMSGGATSGVVAYRNSAYSDASGNPIEGVIPLLAGETKLVQFTEILTAGTTPGFAGELYWGIMAT